MAEERQVVVEAVQLTKLFRDFWMRPKVKALDRVEFQVYRGEIFGLLGPNGSGKSTLLKILLGLLFPTTGRAAVFGRDPRNLAIKDRIGFMPEESYLYRYLNAEETLDFYGRLFNLPAAERRHRVELLLEMVGLTHQRKRPIVEYSKGMARRIGLAQALINDPDLIFLDEPTTGLDPTGTREIKDLILELRRRGKTVLLCSHLLADVEDVCDRVAILYGGRLRRLGSVDELLSLRAKTQITTDRLNPATIEQVVNRIHELEGPAMEVSVQTPRDRLETFFLHVVEEARAARLETSGVTVGAKPSAFFSGIEREQKADVILDELLKTTAERAAEPKETREGEEPPVVVVPLQPEAKGDEQILSGLLKESTPAAAAQTGGASAQRSAAEQRQVVLPASGGGGDDSQTTQDVLKDLLKTGKPGSDEENTEESRTRKTEQ
ncbi:MAG: ABC transporter ATP-binding protein [Candidatus Brocadiia bacterium]